MEDIFADEEFKYISEEELEKALAKDVKDVRRSIEIEAYDDFGLQVWAIAVSKHGDNEDLHIRCEDAVPISDIVYDTVRDFLCVRGVSCHKVGSFPFHFVAGLKGNVWRAVVPAPISVLRRHMGFFEKKEFDSWKTCYPSTDYDIEFIQVLDTYGGEE